MMRAHTIGFTLFISLFYLIGLCLLVWGLYSYFRGRQALSWPTVKGSLPECRLQEHPDSDGPTWEVKVRYAYSVNGKPFEGQRIAFGYSGSGARAEHSGIYDKLQHAAQVVVRYNPANPANSVLAAGFNRQTFIMLAFAATWLSFMIGFTVLAATSSGPDHRIENRIQVVQEN